MSIREQAKTAVEACLSALANLAVSPGLSSALRSSASEVRSKLSKSSANLLDLAVDLSYKSDAYAQELGNLQNFLLRIRPQLSGDLPERLDAVVSSLQARPKLFVQAILADTSQAENIDQLLSPLTQFFVQIKSASTTENLTRQAEVLLFLLENTPPPPPQQAPLDLRAFSQEALQLKELTGDLADILDEPDRTTARGYRSTGLKAYIGVTKALLVIDAEHAAELGKKLDAISAGLKEKLEQIRAQEEALARCIAVLELIATVLSFVAKI